MNIPNTPERLSCSPWRSCGQPERILVIRLHAIGDVAITLPFSAALRNLLPSCRIDFLTATESFDLASASGIFDSIHTSAAHDRLSRIRTATTLGLRLAAMRYDAVIDLQRNWVTRAIRRAAFPEAWAEFDRYAERAATDRTLEAFRRAGFPELNGGLEIPLRRGVLERGRELLLTAGWDSSRPLAVLNPAGLWSSRNWPLEQYVRLGRMMLRKRPWQFLFLGTERVSNNVARIQNELNGVNLVGRTTLGEVLGVLRHVQLMISEDSGLMHIGAAIGVPTLALLGSTNHRWSALTHPASMTLHSGDLECGGCMDPVCRYGDVHCLTRYTPEFVLSKVDQMMAGTEGTTKVA